MMRPKVSVIIPSYNDDKYIEKCINSLLIQTINNIEIFVIDDASTDSTAELIKGMSKNDKRLTLLQNIYNYGPSRSRNIAIAMANGEWIAFLDSDDWYAPRRLEILLEIASEWGTDLVADDMYQIDESTDKQINTAFTERGLKKPEVIDAARFLSLDCGLKTIVRLDFIREHNIFFDERLRNGEDNLFILECLLAGGKCILWPQPLYYYRLRQGSLSSRKLIALKQRQLISMELLNRESLKNNFKVSNLLRKRISNAKKNIILFEFKEYIKKNEILKAIILVINNPYFFIISCQYIYEKLLIVTRKNYKLLTSIILNTKINRHYKK